jgi:hypothetical protein
MMTLTAVFWMLLVIFGVIGGFRGWAKEILVVFSLLLAIAIDILLVTYVDAVKVMMSVQQGPTQFGIRSLLLLTMAYFGYQTPGLPAAITSKLAKDKLQDWMLGAVLGLLNGYFLVGSIWYYMDRAGYPLPYVLPPTDPTVLNYMKYMPPVLLGIPNIYFAVIGAFVFVIIVFI